MGKKAKILEDIPRPAEEKISRFYRAAPTPPQEVASPTITSELHNFRSSEVMKFDSYEVLTTRISASHLDWLNKLETEIRKNRQSLTPRITKNSIMRAIFDVLVEFDFDKNDIRDEQDLAARLRQVMKLKSS